MIEEKNINFTELAKDLAKVWLKNIEGWIEIPSVNGNGGIDESNPFGKEVSNALDYIKNLAIQDGFKAVNYENKIVEITIGDEGKDITMLGHADVVPATGTWTLEPFKLLKKGDMLYARGVSDDKGPTLASYYAAKKLYELGLLKGFHVRLLVGGNEETGSRGVEYYFNELKKPQPTIGFSPDSDFPLIFAEKAILNFDAKGELKLKDVISIEGGVAYNAVIDNTLLKTVSLDLVNFLKNNLKDYEVSEESGVYNVRVFGKAAHGSTPELGLNSAILLLQILAKYERNDRLNDILAAFSDLNGKGLNANVVSKTMGECSLNIGIMKYENNEITLGCNFRFVDGITHEEERKNIVLHSPLDITFNAESPLLYKDLDSDLVKALLSAYQEETGDMESKPLAIGGGTYAKDADNILAFGMQFPGVNTHMHEADESLNMKDLEQGISIYMRALLKLGEVIK